MNESQVLSEPLLFPEATKEIQFSEVVRFNPIFKGTLPFSLKNDNGKFNLKAISQWVKGANRAELSDESPFVSTKDSGRSLGLRIEFSDQKGRKFRFLNIKGGGLTRWGSTEYPGAEKAKSESTDAFPGLNGAGDPLGADYLSNCLYAYDLGAKFDELGARVDVPVMVLKISPEDPELKKLLERFPELAQEDFGVIVRAFRSPYRSGDLRPNYMDRARVEETVNSYGLDGFIEDGLVNAESLAKAKAPDDRLVLYAKALAKSCGQSLGIIHKNSYWIGNRSVQNTSTAAELVDAGDAAVEIDKQKSNVSENLMWGDFRDQLRVVQSLERLRSNLTAEESKNDLSGQELVSQYVRGYKEALPNFDRKYLRQLIEVKIKSWQEKNVVNQWQRLLVNALKT